MFVISLVGAIVFLLLAIVTDESWTRGLAIAGVILNLLLAIRTYKTR
jgi:hypothetical protein